jgi:hypothetical protein
VGVSSGAISDAEAPSDLPVEWTLQGGYLLGPEANLSGADLSGFDLWSPNLAEADLSGAILSSADTDSAVLDGADLSNADLSGAFAGNTSFCAANLSGAQLVEFVGLYSTTDSSCADLTGALVDDTVEMAGDFTGANLGAAVLTDGSLLESSCPYDAYGASSADCPTWQGEVLICPSGIVIGADGYDAAGLNCYGDWTPDTTGCP